MKHCANIFLTDEQILTQRMTLSEIYTLPSLGEVLETDRVGTECRLCAKPSTKTTISGAEQQVCDSCARVRSTVLSEKNNLKREELASAENELR